MAAEAATVTAAKKKWNEEKLFFDRRARKIARERERMSERARKKIICPQEFSERMNNKQWDI